MIDALLHLCQKIFQVRDPFEIQIHFALAHTNEVIVRICHSRDNGRTVQIDNARIRVLKLFRVTVRSDVNDTIAFDSDCFSMRQLFIDRVNVAVDEDQIR